MIGISQDVYCRNRNRIRERERERGKTLNNKKKTFILKTFPIFKNVFGFFKSFREKVFPQTNNNFQFI